MPGSAAQRLVGIRGAGHDFEGAVEDLLRQQLRHLLVLARARRRRAATRRRALSTTTNTPTVAVTPAICLARMPRRTMTTVRSVSGQGLRPSGRGEPPGRRSDRRQADLPVPRIEARGGSACDGLRLLRFPGTRPRSRLSLLCSVFRLMPRISAARVLLSRVCSSVIRISRRSASSTVVPGVSDSVGFATSGESVTSGGSCFGSMNSPELRITARSITLRSSRTLPGQLYCSRMRIAAGSSADTFLLLRALKSARNDWMSSGRSSFRCRSVGSSMAKTLRR